MSFLSAEHMQFLLIEGYILSFIALNSIALLISLFYRKKVQTGAPRGVFLFAILAALCAGAIMIAAGSNNPSLGLIGFIVLGSGGVSSAIGTLSLFSIMRKVSK